MDSKLNLILRAQQRHHSMAEIPTMNSIGVSGPSSSVDTDRSVSQQLLDLDIDYSILKKLRKKCADDDEDKILDSMIYDLRRLKTRVKYMAKRAGNMGAQKRRRNRIDSGIGSEAGDAPDDDEEDVDEDETDETDDEDEDHEQVVGEVEEEKRSAKGIKPVDSTVSFRTCLYVAAQVGAASTTGLAATSTEPPSPGETPKGVVQTEEVRIEETQDVEMSVTPSYRQIDTA